MEGGLAEEKRAARSRMRETLGAMDAAKRATASAAIVDRILAHRDWAEAGVVLAYFSMRDEVDTGPLIRRALDEGKEVFAPRIDGGVMEFRRVAAEDGPCDSGSFGIRQPLPSAPSFHGAPEGRSVLVLVPGLAFDRKGGRLGRGKGYYDRFLAGIPGAERARWRLVALSFGLQIMDAVPSGDDDEFVDAAVTEKEWIEAPKRSVRPPGVRSTRP